MTIFYILFSILISLVGYVSFWYFKNSKDINKFLNINVENEELEEEKQV